MSHIIYSELNFITIFAFTLSLKIKYTYLFTLTQTVVSSYFLCNPPYLGQSVASSFQNGLACSAIYFSATCGIASRFAGSIQSFYSSICCQSAFGRGLPISILQIFGLLSYSRSTFSIFEFVFQYNYFMGSCKDQDIHIDT